MPRTELRFSEARAVLLTPGLLPRDAARWRGLGTVIVERPAALPVSRPITAAPASVPICFKQKAGWGEGTSMEAECNWKLPLYCKKKSLERK